MFMLNLQAGRRRYPSTIDQPPDCGAFHSQPVNGGVWGQSRGKEELPMREYELVLVANADLDETALNDLISKVKNWISDGNGEVSKIDLWGKRKLAYPIRKQIEGIYVLLNAKMSPKYGATLERNLRFTEAVLRFLLVVKD
jgi:small subunit ribosomal protein S6